MDKDYQYEMEKQQYSTVKICYSRYRGVQQTRIKKVKVKRTV